MWAQPHQQQLSAQFAGLGLYNLPYQSQGIYHSQAVEPDTEFDYAAEVGQPLFPAAPQQLEGHLQPFAIDGLGPGLLGTGSCGAVFTAYHGHRMVSAGSHFRAFASGDWPTTGIWPSAVGLLEMLPSHPFSGTPKLAMNAQGPGAYCDAAVLCCVPGAVLCCRCAVPSFAELTRCCAVLCW